MILDSCGNGWQCDHHGKLNVYVLEVRDLEKPKDEKPIAWLLVERNEKYTYDRSCDLLDTASICLNYHQIQARYSSGTVKGGSFSGGYCRSGNAVSLSSSQPNTSGGIFTDPPELRGQHIGTHFLNEIVIWAQQWPGATVQSIELAEGQADDCNKGRRNHFYEQFGLVFDYQDSEHRQGLSRPMPASELTPVDAWEENLAVLDLRDYLADLVYEKEALATQIDQRDRSIKYWTELAEHAEARPLRWVWSRMWPAALAAAIPVSIILVTWFSFISDT